MKIAVEGCAHGELDKIYESIQALENRHRIKIDLLIICGDFQSVRNPADLEGMAVPPKYRKLNTFYKYYSGEKKAPILTIFIGGNHEASNYLSELSYGGWVCPNIYYMGYANVINIGGLRIAGLSGIYKGQDYLKGHFETPPYDKSTVKSIYHVRNVDVFRLKQLKRPIDICISHDWPRSVYKHGDMEQLLRFKPFFREEMESDKLGSQPGEELLKKLKPSYWFAAHLHCKFSALVPHDDEKGAFTKFLALDKCLPRRRFLQVLDIGKAVDFPQIEYDPEWLCILRSTNHLLNVSRRSSFMPGAGGTERWDFTPNDEELDSIKGILNDDLKVPCNFVVTAPTFLAGGSSPTSSLMKKYLNPQTQTFCKLFNLTDPQQAVSSPDSFTISDFSGTEFNSSNPTSFDPDELSRSSSDEETVDCSQDDDNQEFLGFFIDRIGSLGNKSKRTSPKNQSDVSTELSNLELFPDIKTENRVCSTESKNVQKFLQDQPDNPEILIKQTKLESFPEIKTENLKGDATSSEQISSSFVFKRRNQSLYASTESSELSTEQEVDDSLGKRFKRSVFPACHNVE
ncbi:uncharacterized protein [Parasteatoda tepidariorum]|uniref:uncharacterized protein n=1 Tax=Parasteatoda tepidariorum TaxID=114398 RepID=UPI00077FCBFF|nr:lariat debranching enzyme A [Parasteatoda tepidariorum]